MLKKLLALLALLVSAPAFPAAVTFVSGSASAHYNTGTTCNIAATYTPTAGNDIILTIVTFTASVTVSGVADSAGATITQDVPFAINTTYNMGFGVYRIHNATAVAHEITVTFSAATACYASQIEANDVGSFDSNQTTVSTGTTADLQPNSLTPSVNGALLIAWGGIGTAKTVTTTWNEGFTTLINRTAGPSAFPAYLDQATAAAVSPTLVMSSAGDWSALVVSYIPSTTVCTHSGIASNGSISVPNGSSGSYRLANGTIGTPDCASVLYPNSAGGIAVN